jgi:hypothetical protein
VGEEVRDGVGARPGANGDVLPVGEAQPGRLLKEGGARLAKAQEDGRGADAPVTVLNWLQKCTTAFCSRFNSVTALKFP